MPEARNAGTALVEAVIVAPIFALVLSAALALHSMYSAKLAAKERARRLAWLQADSGECPESSCKTPECERSLEEVEGVLDGTRVTGNGLSLEAFLGEIRSFLVGRMTRGVTSVTSRTPRMFSGGSSTQSGVTGLVCNTRARHTSDGSSVLDHACRAGLQGTEYAREVCR